MTVDFGGCFAYKDDGAQLGKSSEGEQDGQEEQETIEEGEEAGSNEAANRIRKINSQQTIRLGSLELSGPSESCGTRAKAFSIRREAAAAEAAASFFCFARFSRSRRVRAPQTETSLAEKSEQGDAIFRAV